MPKSKSRKKRSPKRVLALPDLEQAKTAVLNSLTSAQRPADLRACDSRVRGLVPLGAGSRVQPHGGGHVRTVPIPGWVKAAVDAWTDAVHITHDPAFRAIKKAGRVWGDGMSPKVLWDVVRAAAGRAGIDRLAPHDLRRTCAGLCHLAGGELDQIQFLLEHVSIQTTERYLGCKQRLRCAVNDRLGIEPDAA